MKKRNNNPNPTKAKQTKSPTTTTQRTPDATASKLKAKVNSFCWNVGFDKTNLEKVMKKFTRQMQGLEPDVLDQLIPELTKAVEDLEASVTAMQAYAETIRTWIGTKIEDKAPA